MLVASSSFFTKELVMTHIVVFDCHGSVPYFLLPSHASKNYYVLVLRDLCVQVESCPQTIQCGAGVWTLSQCSLHSAFQSGSTHNILLHCRGARGRLLKNRMPVSLSWVTRGATFPFTGNCHSHLVLLE